MTFSLPSFKTLAALVSVLLLPSLCPSTALGAIIRAPQVSPELSEKILGMEREQENIYETYFDRELAEVSQSPADIAVTLAELEQETGQRAAVLWVKPQAEFLHLVLITPGEEPIVRDLPDVSPTTIVSAAQLFRREVMDPFSRRYLTIGERLHQWLIEPFEAEFLKPRGIDSLLVCLWSGLRGLPLGAIYDGKQFLIEKYSVTTIPAFNLIDHQYTDPSQRRNILAMGASEFQDQAPLPAVPLELGNISKTFQQERSFLNQDFTVANLEQQLRQADRDYSPFNVVHLATHASFQPGTPANSYIQFWDRRLHLNEIADIPWNRPLDLLVLSACETAVGNNEAEMGFAGLALNAGVKSALASLWSVSDAGTLVLMSEFYQQLQSAPTKAEALRQAQLRLLRKESQVQSDRLILSRGEISVPSSLNLTGQTEFSHPFFWAGFTLISSPW